MKYFLPILSFAIILSGLDSFAQGSFAPSAENTGSTAIYKDSSIIKSWATGIELKRGWVNIADTSVKVGGSNKASFGYPAAALGKAEGTSTNVVSLGDSGVAILTFDRPIANGNGPDFAVFENGFSNNYLELAFVEVSSDGKRFVRFPSVSLTQNTLQVGSFGTLDPTNLYNLAGKYMQGYGTPFDLDDIKDSSNIDLNNIRFVKVVDVVGDIKAPYASHDSKGNVINDPFPTPYASCGFDLEAISVSNGGQPYSISTLDELSLTKDTFWNHSASDTAFTSGLALFSSYRDIYDEINGFAYSNQRNDTTPGYHNGYSAITIGGMNAPDSGGTNYAVAYVNTYAQIPSISFTDNKSHTVSGFYVTNNTYAYLSMKKGDAPPAKKFGGTMGNDPDWFKLMVWGNKEDGTKTDIVEFYLADFRFADNSKDYILKDWQWVDLKKLGKVKKLSFSLNSSDVGQWGMNTPSYFCLDNLTVLPDAAPVSLSKLADVNVKMNALPVSVALASAFTAYDTTGIALAVASNTNTDLVHTAISGKKLTLSFTTNKIGEAQIVISATLNNQTVTNTINITVTSTTGMHNTLASNAKVYPNPFRDNLTVECDESSQVMLFDLFGRKIKEQQASTNIAQISADGLTAGYYILKIVNNSGTETIKVLKQ